MKIIQPEPIISETLQTIIDVIIISNISNNKNRIKCCDVCSYKALLYYIKLSSKPYHMLHSYHHTYSYNGFCFRRCLFSSLFLSSTRNVTSRDRIDRPVKTYPMMTDLENSRLFFFVFVNVCVCVCACVMWVCEKQRKKEELLLRTALLRSLGGWIGFTITTGVSSTLLLLSTTTTTRGSG